MTWTRREFARAGALAGVGAASWRWVLGGDSLAADATDTPAPGGYDAWIVVDGCGSPGDSSSEEVAPLTDRAVADVRASGVTCINLTVGPVGNRPGRDAFEGIVRDIARWQREIDAHPDALLQVRKTGDVAAAKTSQRLGLIFGLQDGVAFQEDLSVLEILRGLGVLIVQPTYNLRNLLGDGCLEPPDAGLSRIGRAAVEKMNALGILVDLSHCGRRTTADAIDASAKPVAFTHTGCAALHDHPRNKTDEQLRALAGKGGVAGIYVMPYLRPKGQPTADDVVSHLDHAIDVAGEDHIGVGTDGSLSPVNLTPEYVKAFEEQTAARKKSGIGAPGEDPIAYLFAADLNTARRLETLAGMLSKRGHTGARIEKILGGNFARLFAEAWG
jgi:membrane dipeptidase